jgi:phospholipase/carboxylesterase
MSRAVLALLVVALAAACGSGSKEKAATTQPPPSPQAAEQGRLSARPSEPGEADGGETGLQELGSARLYVPPGDRPKRLVVSLHGAGGVPDDALDLFRPYADEAELIVLAPKSSGPTWDVAQGGFGPDVLAIDRLLAQVFAEHDVDQVAVAGFSDGASYALSLGLTNGDLFRSVIAFSPGFIAYQQATGAPRLFISHGTHDSVLPIGRTSRRGVPSLRAAGYRVRYREFDGEHEVPGPIVQEAVEWLSEG